MFFCVITYLSLLYICRVDGSNSEAFTCTTTTKKVCKGRKKSLRPEVKYTVTSINKYNGAPFKPDVCRRKFSSICGIVARERVSINLASWKEVSKTARDDIKKEVLKYFIIRNKDDLKRAGRVALLIAGKVWKQWSLSS